MTTRRWVFAALALVTALNTGCCRLWDRWCDRDDHRGGGGYNGCYCPPSNNCAPGGNVGYIAPQSCPPASAPYPR